MILCLSLGFGLGVLATVVVGERDKRQRRVHFDLIVEYPHRVFGDVSLTKCSEPTYGRFQDHT